jgi:hypothetical protein
MKNKKDMEDKAIKTLDHMKSLIKDNGISDYFIVFNLPTEGSARSIVVQYDSTDYFNLVNLVDLYLFELKLNVLNTLNSIQSKQESISSSKLQ